jgi:hypothetical protein
MLLFRKILFYCFFLAYLILCPILIFYALGINYKVEGKALEKTGLIYLTTTPPQASVYIDHERFKDLTPAVISNLPAGSYSVDIILKNCKPWHKILTVQESKATTAEHVLLIPSHWRRQSLLKEPYQEIFAVSDFPFLLMKKGNTLKDLYLLRWKEGLGEDFLEQVEAINKLDFLPLWPATEPFISTKLLRIISVPESPTFFIETEQGGQKKYFWTNVTLKTPAPKDITDLILEEPKTIFWERRNENIVYIQSHEDSINILNIGDHTVRPHLVEGVQSFTVYNNRIYALMNDYSLEIFNDKADVLRTLVLPAQTLEYLTRSKSWEITVLSDDIVFFRNSKGTLLFNVAPFHLRPEQNIQGFEFDKANRRIILWSPHNIAFADLIDEHENKFLKISWLNLNGKDITKALWINKGHQILFIDGDTVFLTDTESFGQSEFHEVTKIKHDGSIAYSDNIGRLFYLTDNEDYLASLEIIAQQYLLSLPSLGRDQKSKRTQNSQE